MAYDQEHGTVVVFGGNGPPDGSLNDTWTWDGQDWIQQKPAASPSARDSFGMVYDAARHVTLLFGGSNGGFLGDTWTWDGHNSTQKKPAVSPSPRADAGMAYDQQRGVVVLFGGEGPAPGNNNSHVTAVLNDTWTWDGRQWTQQHPPGRPPPRSGASLAYDPIRQTVVLFGGANAYVADDTWTWDGKTWTLQGPTHSPPGRRGAAMAFDENRGEMVLFGGQGQESSFSDTWVWDGSRWTFAGYTSTPSGPVLLARMVYDAARHQLFLMTTTIVSKDGFILKTWTWDAANWQELH